LWRKITNVKKSYRRKQLEFSFSGWANSKRFSCRKSGTDEVQKILTENSDHDNSDLENSDLETFELGRVRRPP
jgi:hypothetical protein